MHKKKYSRPFVASVIGVISIAAILTAIWLNHQHELNDLRHTIVEGQLAVDKMGLISSMIETARARTRLTNQMTYVDDVFEKDDINMQLDRYAATFAQLRKRFKSMELSDLEVAILGSQSHIIVPTLARQRQAAELAMSDSPADIERAKKILIREVYPGQGKIIDHFLQLLSLQKLKINTAARATNLQFESNRRIQNLLFLLVGVAVLVIATISLKRLRKADVFEHEANHDELTGLLNRRDFERRVTQVFNQCSSCGCLALGLIDLDNFKRVNDTAGHSAGDELLRQVAWRIKAKLRRRDLLARIGGDEFAFLLIDADAEAIERITNDILDIVAGTALEWDGNFHHISASIGVVALEADSVRDYKTQYRRADDACYRAKADGKNRIDLVNDYLPQSYSPRRAAVVNVRD